MHARSTTSPWHLALLAPIAIALTLAACATRDARTDQAASPAINTPAARPAPITTARDRLAQLALQPASSGPIDAKAPSIAPGLPVDLARSIARDPRTLSPDAGMTLDEVIALDRWRPPITPPPPPPSPRDRQASLRAYLAGRLALAQDDTQGAILRLRHASQLNQTSPEPLQQLGQALLASGDPRSASQTLRQAASLAQMPSRVLAFLAQEAADRDDHEQAVAFSLQALQADELTPELGLAPALDRTLARSLDRLGYSSASRDALARVQQRLSALPTDRRIAPEAAALQRQAPAIQRDLGDAELRLGNPARALDAYESAARLTTVERAELEPRLMTAAALAGRPWLAVHLVFQSLEHSRGRLDAPRRLRLQAAATLPNAREPLLAAIREWRDEASLDRPSLAAKLSLASLALIPPDQAHRELQHHLSLAPNDAAATAQWLAGITPDSALPERAANLLTRVPLVSESIARAVTSSGERAPRLIAALQADASPASCLLIAQIRTRVGDPRGAIAAGQHESSPAMLRARGLAAADVGDQHTAQSAREALIATGDPAWIVQAARISLRASEPEAALDLLGPLLANQSLDPRHRIDALIAQAEAAIIAKRAPLALDAVARVLAIDPEHERALSLQLAITQPTGLVPDSTIASRAQRDLRELGESTRELVLSQAREHANLHRWDPCLRTLAPLLADDPLDPTALPIAIEAHEARALTAPKSAAESIARFSLQAQHLDSPTLRLAHARVLAASLVSLGTAATPEARASALALLDELQQQGQPPRWPPELHDRRLVLLIQSLPNDSPEPVRQAAAFAHTQHPALKELPFLRAAGLAERLGHPKVTLAMLLHAFERTDTIEPGLLQRTIQLLVLVGDAHDARRFIDLANAQSKLPVVLLLFVRPESPLLQAGANFRAETAYVLGSAAWGSGRSTEALALLELAIEYQPAHAWANNDLGYFLADAGRDLAKAERHLLVAFAALPHDGSIVDSIAWLRYKQGRLEDSNDPATGVITPGALSLFARAAATEKGRLNNTLFDHYGDALWASGKKPEAIQAWQNADRLAAFARANPEQPLTDAALADLDARVARIRAKVAAARAGQVPTIAPQGEHATAVQTPDPPR